MELREWDAAEVIRDAEDVHIYLEESAKSGDPAEIANAINSVARAYGIAQLAKESGIPAERIFAALNKYPGPDKAELRRLLDALGVSADGDGKHSNAAE